MIKHWLNEKWVNLYRYTNAYDESGNVLVKADERWSDRQWICLNRFTATYDASGNVLAALYEYGSNGHLESSHRYLYSYDASGNMLTFQHEDRPMGQLVGSERDTYTYDPQGNLGSIWHHELRSSSWMPVGTTSCFIYDGGCNEYYFEGYNVTLTYKTLTTAAALQDGTVPEACALFQNYPNPFNPSTTIRYGIPARSHVTLNVFNTVGQEVAELVRGEQDAGYHEVTFNAQNLPSGVYFYRLRAGNYSETKKLLIVR